MMKACTSAPLRHWCRRFEESTHALRCPTAFASRPCFLAQKAVELQTFQSHTYIGPSTTLTMSLLSRVASRTIPRRLFSNAAATSDVREIPSPGGKWPILGHLPRMMVCVEVEFDIVVGHPLMLFLATFYSNNSKVKVSRIGETFMRKRGRSSRWTSWAKRLS